MAKIFSSASKMAFIGLIYTACVAFLYEVFRGVVVLDTKDFMVLATGASAFYFSYKGKETGAGSGEPFAGK